MSLLRNIAVFTGSRADYGLLYWTLKALKDHPFFNLALMVGGNHHLARWGNTVQYIKNDGFDIGCSLEVAISGESSLDTVLVTSETQRLSALYFDQNRPDAVMLLGDRYEAFAVATAAFLMGIPVIHLHGGEVTFGALDEGLRHAITKLSTWHITAAEAYRNRVIQLGVQPSHVWNFGAPGLEYLHRMAPWSFQALSESLEGWLNGPFLLVTYHPETTGKHSLQDQQALFNALDQRRDLQVLITYPNADAEGGHLLDRLLEWARSQPERIRAVPSLGQARYLSAMKLCEAVVGNSSSGLIEAPSCQVPTVNIGSRQQGREMATSVICSTADAQDIGKALDLALSEPFKRRCLDTINPYESGPFSSRFVSWLGGLNAEAAGMPPFYDVPTMSTAMPAPGETNE